MSSPTLHILHLARREDRLQQLLRQLAWNRVPNVIWDGIDDPNNVKQAITRGHKKIIQYAKDNKLPFINIAEDDIIFTHKDSYKYFNEQVPEDYDLFFGLFYQAEINEERRILNGMSGVLTLFRVNERFYDFFLGMPDDVYTDRYLGLTAFEHKYYVVPEFCCFQSGGWSDNLRQVMYYDVYLQNKKMYGVD